MSQTRTVAMTILSMVGGTLLVSLIYAILGLWSDVATIKTQQQFYHGPWPPPYQGHP